VEEGLIFAGLGLLVGLGIGGLGAYALNGFLERQVPGLPAGFSFVTFDAGVLASGILEVLMIGLLASVGPALRAMALPVAEELRAP
ncbi:MAG TPA: ABC transporter permease, partial [Thermoplasmata archaeon]